jgi:hypothetical protein
MEIQCSGRFSELLPSFLASAVLSKRVPTPTRSHVQSRHRTNVCKNPNGRSPDPLQTFDMVGYPLQERSLVFYSSFDDASHTNMVSRPLATMGGFERGKNCPVQT